MARRDGSRVVEEAVAALAGTMSLGRFSRSSSVQPQMDTPVETGHRETLGPVCGGTIRDAKTSFSLRLCQRLPRVRVLGHPLEVSTDDHPEFPLSLADGVNFFVDLLSIRLWIFHDAPSNHRDFSTQGSSHAASVTALLE